MKSSSQTVIDVPANRVDLRAWLERSQFRCSVEVRLPPLQPSDDQSAHSAREMTA